jgi:hypothetical protein
MNQMDTFEHLIVSESEKRMRNAKTGIRVVAYKMGRSPSTWDRKRKLVDPIAHSIVTGMLDLKWLPSQFVW